MGRPAGARRPAVGNLIVDVCAAFRACGNGWSQMLTAVGTPNRRVLPHTRTELKQILNGRLVHQSPAPHPHGAESAASRRIRL